MAPPPPPPSPSRLPLPIIIHHHPTPQDLLTHLRPLLPFSLPIVRRLQFRFQSPYARFLSTISEPEPETESEPEFLGKASAANSSAAESSAAAPFVAAPSFAAAYLDRSRSPETECWIFSTIELAATSPSQEAIAEAKDQLFALLAHISTICLPLPPTSFETAKAKAKASAPGPLLVSPPSLLLVGSIHSRVLEILKDGAVIEKTTAARATASARAMKVISGPNAKDRIHGSVEQGNGNAGGCIRGHTVPYTKYLFVPRGEGEGDEAKADEAKADEAKADEAKVDEAKADEAKAVAAVGKCAEENELLLPSDLEWSHVHASEIPLVLSRTEIPRTERTLRLLPSVAVRKEKKKMGSCSRSHSIVATTTTTGTDSSHNNREEEETETERGEIVAWAFLGPDASLTSLHVEPGFRGRGLGKKVAARIFARMYEGEGEGGGGGGGEEGDGEREREKAFLGVGRGQEWCHSDVAADNKESIGVARGVGGKEGWECYWGWVDLDLAKATSMVPRR